MKDVIDVAKNLTPGVILLAAIGLFFYIYSTTGEFLFLVLTGISIILIPATYLLKAPFEEWRSSREKSAGRELGELIGFLPTYLATRSYRLSYFEFLTSKHSVFDVKGLTTQGVFSLDLEKVFVELSIVAEPLSSNNPLTPPRMLKEGRRDIWSYLRDSRYKHLAVLGIPGCGKTTLLKYVALTLVHRTRQTSKEIPAKLPILLFLRDHSHAIADNPNIKLIELIHQSLSVLEETASTPTRWFENYLKNGHCLVMFDGLDEVGDPLLRKKVAVWVNKVIETYHKNRFIISSRPHGYHSNPIEGMTQLQVQNFNSEQIQKFIKNWYQATEVMSQQRSKDDRRVRLAAQEGANDLLKRVQSTPDIAALALNPLLLTMIANVHRWRSSLPGRRVELYAEMCEVFLGKRHLASGVEDGLTPAQKQAVLQALAYKMMQEEKRELPLNQILDIVEAPLKLVNGAMSGEIFIHLVRDGSGILIERELETYAFSHKTFQEFLAAVYVEKEKCLPYLLTKLDEDWWHESIRLYCARNDATSIITNCLTESPLPLKRLVLAIECANEALQIDSKVRQQLNEMIEEGLDSDNRERRTVAAKAKLALRVAHLSRLDDTRYADNALVPHAEFQLFLDEYPQYTPDYWGDLDLPKGKARSPVIGINPVAAETFCDWLTETNTLALGWRYRLPKEAELELGPYWIKTQDAYIPAQVYPIQQTLHEWAAMDLANISEDLPKDLLQESISVDFQAFKARRIFQLVEFQLRALLNEYKSHDLAFDIVIDLKPIFEHNLPDAPNRTTASTLILAHTITSILDTLLEHARVRTLTHDLDSDLALASTISNTLALDLVSTPNLDHARIRAYDLNRTIARASTLANTGVRVRDLAAFILLFKIFHNISHFITLLIEQLIWGDAYSPNLGPYLDKDLAPFRLWLLDQIQHHYVNQPNVLNRVVGSAWQTWRDEMDDLLCCYAQFVTLEKRCRGEWKAFESIKIVREKIQEETPLFKK